jgi:signal peptidase II
LATPRTIRLVNRLRLVLPIVLCVLVLDRATKLLATAHLAPAHEPHRVLGDVVRLTLVRNRGAALGLPLGAHARWPLAAVAVVVTVLLGVWMTRTPVRARARLVALSLVLAGALGNLGDRVRSARGVVDFIDVGVGPWRFWTFNVADAAITTGVALLLWIGWRESRRARPPDAGSPGA